MKFKSNSNEIQVKFIYKPNENSNDIQIKFIYKPNENSNDIQIKFKQKPNEIQTKAKYKSNKSQKNNRFPTACFSGPKGRAPYPRGRTPSRLTRDGAPFKLPSPSP